MGSDTALCLPEKTRTRRTQIYRSSALRSISFWQNFGPVPARHRDGNDSASRRRPTNPKRPPLNPLPNFPLANQVRPDYICFLNGNLFYTKSIFPAPRLLYFRSPAGGLFCCEKLFKEIPVSSRTRAKRCRSRRAKPTVRGERAQPRPRRTGGFDQRRPTPLQPREDRWGF